LKVQESTESDVIGENPDDKHGRDYENDISVCSRVLSSEDFAAVATFSKSFNCDVKSLRHLWNERYNQCMLLLKQALARACKYIKNAELAAFGLIGDFHSFVSIQGVYGKKRVESWMQSVKECAYVHAEQASRSVTMRFEGLKGLAHLHVDKIKRAAPAFVRNAKKVTFQQPFIWKVISFKASKVWNWSLFWSFPYFPA
jgi:hypothetical protein